MTYHVVMSRPAFLDTLDATAAFLLAPKFAEVWTRPAALEGYTIGGLAGHTARAAITVEQYLHEPAPSGQAITPAEYFVRALRNADPITDEAHQSVRQRGERAGSIGPEALAGEIGAIRRRLAARFQTELPNRLVRVYGDATMLLDRYLETRLVELIIHLDDLAASAELPLPPVSEDVQSIVLEVLVEMSKARHGTEAVIRAFARRERVVDWPTAF